jgi:hypothetical protein
MEGVDISSCSNSGACGHVHLAWVTQSLWSLQGPNETELSRDFTFIDDIVAGVIAALRKSKPSIKGQAQYKARFAAERCRFSLPVILCMVLELVWPWIAPCLQSHPVQQIASQGPC